MKLTPIAAALLALPALATVTTAWAQASTPAAQRVEITGSSIKRIQTEGALPIQVITREDIERQGIVSAEQLVATITANGNGADNLSSNTGISYSGPGDRNNNGNSSANLRGLGSNSTLVLLNGRRVSLHGAKGNSVDLSSIPLAAVERVEVLKDGASAIYGTDAIGGVINFIMRKNFTGVQVGGGLDVTQDGGGNVYRANLMFGTGNLERDRFNLLATVSVDRQERLDASQRPFVNGYQPERGLSPDTTGTPFATQTGGTGTGMGASFTLPTTGATIYTRANLLSFEGKCNTVPQMSQYDSVLWGSPSFRWGCAFDYVGQQVLIQPVDRINAVARATISLNPNHNLILEAVASRTDSQKYFEHSQITTSIGAGNAYPVSGPYYQNLKAYIPSFDPTKPIAYRWRCIPCGKRTIDTESNAFRFLAALEGVIDGWDYKLGASTAGSDATSVLGDGYMRTTDFNTVLASGIVNPWLLPGQSQTQAAMDAINAAKATGTRLFGGKASLAQVDGTISGEIFRLPAGPVSVAAGFDLRVETYQFSDGSTTTVPVRDAPFDPEFPRVKRDIRATFAEIAVPLARNLELTAALRHDSYSDFGGTTNPKVSLRFNPVPQLLFRGSYNTGFRAPSFFQLYGATTEAQVPGNLADPVLCPNGPTAAGADPTVCAIRPLARQGGNKDLKPETSKQWTIGFVAQPVDWFSFSADMWEVRRNDLIYQLTPQQVVANYLTFPENLVRGSNGRLDGTGGYIRAGFVNADGDIARGTDVSAQANGRILAGTWKASLEGTYFESRRSRVFASQPYIEYAGQWGSRDITPRWKHQLGFTYTQGPWSGTLSQSFTKGYLDEKPLGVIPPGFNPMVDDYITYNLAVSYTGIKNVTLNAGIRNLLNTDPPFTAHNVDFAAGAGWDPRVADPRGRAFRLSATYKF